MPYDYMNDDGTLVQMQSASCSSVPFLSDRGLGNPLPPDLCSSDEAVPGRRAERHRRGGQHPDKRRHVHPVSEDLDLDLLVKI